MPFGVVSGVGLCMSVLNFGGDRRRVRGSLELWGVNLRRPIVTKGEFVASLCENAYSDPAVVWRGEWSGPRHSCVRWKYVLQGEGTVSGVVFGIFRQLRMHCFNRRHDAEKCIRLVCEKLAVFPYARYTIEFCVKFPFL